MAGQIDEAVPEEVRVQAAALLDGRAPSADPQGEGYRLLLVAACNQWHARMPFLFEEIEDYTELLMPEDLLSPDSSPRPDASSDECGGLPGRRDIGGSISSTSPRRKTRYLQR